MSQMVCCRLLAIPEPFSDHQEVGEGEEGPRQKEQEEARHGQGDRAAGRHHSGQGRFFTGMLRRLSELHLDITEFKITKDKR